MSDATQEIKEWKDDNPTPTAPVREPMDPEDRGLLIGFVVACVAVVSFVGVVGYTCIRNNDQGNKAQSEQIESCSNMEEPSAAILCVEKVEE